jgi:hypothetical protein
MPFVLLTPPWYKTEGDKGKISSSPHARALADQTVLLNMLEVKELLDWMVDYLWFEENLASGTSGTARRRRGGWWLRRR